MRDYHRQLYANKMDNLEEMDKFLEKHVFKTEPGRDRTYKQTQALKNINNHKH